MSQLRAVTWFEAQTICRENKQSLTVWKNESTNFYWTGFYKKTSHWIKIIGDLLDNSNHAITCSPKFVITNHNVICILFD